MEVERRSVRMIERFLMGESQQCPPTPRVTWLGESFSDRPTLPTVSPCHCLRLSHFAFSNPHVDVAAPSQSGHLPNSRTQNDALHDEMIDARTVQNSGDGIGVANLGDSVVEHSPLRRRDLRGMFPGHAQSDDMGAE